MRLEIDGAAVFVGTGSRPLPEPRGRAVLFVHGAGMDHTVWVMPARHFARKGFAVLAPDLPAHGRSGGAALDSISAVAGWLDDLCAALDCERVCVVGHSMGSLAACALAAAYPTRCERLVLLGTSAPMPVSDRLLEAAADGDHAAVEMANSWSHSRGRLGGNANPGLWMMTSGERLIERARPEVFHADLAACNGYDPATLEAVRCPVTVIAGTADLMTPQQAGRQVFETLAAQVDAHFVSIPGSGHSMLAEYPNEVLDAIVAALEV